MPSADRAHSATPGTTVYVLTVVKAATPTAQIVDRIFYLSIQPHNETLAFDEERMRSTVANEPFWRRSSRIFLRELGSYSPSWSFRVGRLPGSSCTAEARDGKPHRGSLPRSQPPAHRVPIEIPYGNLACNRIIPNMRQTSIAVKGLLQLCSLLNPGEST